MKIKTLIIVLSSCILFFTQVSLGTEDKNQVTPEHQAVEKQAPPQGDPLAYVTSDTYEFSSVIEGNDVTHTFTVQNKGTGPMKIQKVGTGWGCAATSYTREPIPPGGEGTVTVKVNTSGRGGKLKKTATVYTDDPKHPRIVLTISGQVEKFADIIPKRISLKGAVGQRITSSVTIVPKEKYPFNILEAKPSKGQNISIKWEKKEGEKGSQYLLTVENLKKEEGRYFDTVLLKTDSKLKPEIKISVYGNISDNNKG